MSRPNSRPSRRPPRPLIQLSRRQMVFLSVLLTWIAFEIAGVRPFGLDFERSTWEGLAGLHVKTEVRGLVAHSLVEGKLYATRSDDLFVSGNGGTTWSRLGQLEARDYSRGESWGRSIRRSRVGRALWPGQHPTAVLPLLDGGVVAIHSPWIQRSYDGGRSWGRVHEIGPLPRASGGNSLVQEPSGRLWTLAGEGDAHLLFSDDSARTWDGVTLELAEGPQQAVVPGPVTSVQLDPLRGRVWLTTGGEGEQVQIGWLEADGRFRAIGLGKDEFRAGSLMFTSEHVYWACDTPGVPGGVWRWARIDEQVEQVAKLPGPARNSTILADGSLVVATRVDAPGAQNLEVWGSIDGTHWASLLRTRAPDARTRRGLATALFVAGEPSRQLVFTVDGFGARVPATLVADWIR